jgi:hypothetical protein
MSKPYGSRDLSEALTDVLTGISKWLFWIGLILTLGATGVLIYTCFVVGGDSSAAGMATKNVDTLQQVEILSSLALAIGGSILFWGESWAAGLLVLLSGAMFFAPAYVPSIMNSVSPNGTPAPAAQATILTALHGIQSGGLILGLISVLVLGAEVFLSVRTRARVGVKADTLKFGKGVKEEADRQNVFMGNCWQLPYCRKFVRERCPIFHSKKTCWRERVGCMCEEEVIRNAMENKPIPKDALLASKMIPQNFRLNDQQKAERCRNCVIYNEHQRHKYRLSLPIVLIVFIGAYAGLHGPLMAATKNAVTHVNTVVNNGLINSKVTFETPTFFLEGLLFVFMLVALSYVLKAVEFAIFKLKL